MSGEPKVCCTGIRLYGCFNDGRLLKTERGPAESSAVALNWGIVKDKWQTQFEMSCFW